jgi:hypothetical protein
VGLCKNGVPFKIAFGIPESEHVMLDNFEINAYAIIAGELEGNEFDWALMRWKSK